MKPRDWATFLLQSAAEVEHALMIQYLYAAYSLRTGSDAPAGAKTVSWQTAIVQIAREEMGHLLTVQNLLRLIGGPPSYERDAFPIRTLFYPFPFKLERLTKDSLSKYLFAEMTPGAVPVDVLTPAERDEIEKRAKQAAAADAIPLGLAGMPFINHVGAIYVALDDVFQHELDKDKDLRTDRDDWQSTDWSGTTPNTDNLTGVKLLPTRNLDEALLAIDTVARQGEVADSPGSHFTRFLKIYRDCPTDTKPLTWAVRENPTTNPDTPGGTLLENQTTKLWAALFNLRYRILLMALTHSTAIPSTAKSASGKSLRDTLNVWVYQEMKRGAGSLKDLASQRLARLPAGNDPAVLAGAPFDMPYSLLLPDKGPERWRLHLDLIEASKDVIAELNAPDDPYLKGIIQRDDLRRADITALQNSEL
jgi:hypothetical protein